MRDMRDPGRRLLLGRRRRQRARSDRRARRRKAPSTSGATPRSAPCSAPTPTWSRRRFGIEPDGNAPNDPHGEFTGQNMLYTARVDRGRRGRDRAGRRATSSPSLGRARADAVRGRAQTAAAAPRRQGADVVERHDDRRVRPRRTRPARTGRRPARGSSGAGRGAFIRDRCGAPPTAPCCAAGATATRRIDGYAEDYASLVWGLLELFQATAIPPGWPGRASCRRSRTRASGMSRTAAGSAPPGRDPSVLLRLKEDYDGAEPSASSVSVLNLLTLAHLAGR